MLFLVTLRNQLTGVEKEVELKSSYDAVSVIAKEAKQRMNIPEAWDYIESHRID